MHELSYTRSILDAVVSSAEKAQAKKVKSVHLVIGEVRDIVDELFCGCFAYLAKNTIAADAQVFIERIPLTLFCHTCNETFHADAFSSRAITCPNCGKDDYEIRGGMEFRIESIEIC